jgi:hypothetical protein
MNDCNSSDEATCITDGDVAVEGIMPRYWTLISLACALAACSGSNVPQSDNVATKAGTVKAAGEIVPITPGLWETKTIFKTIDAKGLSEGSKAQMIAAMGKGVSVKTCLTKEQVEQPDAEFFGTPKGSNCVLQHIDITAINATIIMTCKPDAKTVIESQMTGQFSVDNYAMNIEQKTSGTPMGDLTTTGRVEGKRLGNCPA